MKQAVDPYASFRELTLRGMILGALITVIFTASNVYLGLKVGLTFASSIPAAVISMAVLKFFKGSNILENNMVQTQASAAGTLSSIIFILPGLLMAGYWAGFPFWQTTLLCMSGGILGVIFTVPLRYAMVVKSDLPYPEGVAAAEILKVGDHDADQQEGGSGIKELVSGGALAGLMSFCASGLRVVADSASFWFKGGASVFQVPMGFSLALLGAGYLVGLTGGIAILLGISIAWGVAVPYLSAHIPQPADMEMIPFAMSLWKEKVRFIGAGTIGIAAIWTLLTLMKPMVEGMRLSFRNFGGVQMTERTEQDLSPKANDCLGVGDDAGVGRVFLPLYRRLAYFRRFGLAVGGRVYAAGFDYRLFGGRGLRLYGRFGRFVFQPDFGCGHRLYRYHFAGVAAGWRIRRLDDGRGKPQIPAGVDAVLRRVCDLCGFDFQ